MPCEKIGSAVGVASKVNSLGINSIFLGDLFDQTLHVLLIVGPHIEVVAAGISRIPHLIPRVIFCSIWMEVDEPILVSDVLHAEVIISFDPAAAVSVEVR